MEIDDRQTDIPEDREAYEFAACVATAPATIPPEAGDNGQNDYEGGW